MAVQKSEETPSRRLQLAGQILELARRDGIKPGERMFEHRLAQRLGVSRGPVRTGLQQLAASGLALAVPNKGYVLTKSLDSDVARATMATASALEAQYMTIADDRLEGRLPDVVSEKELMRRYSLKRPDVLRLLHRIAGEGWIERQPGYGWKFVETVSSADAYLQANRYRMLIEPAGILEPEFKLNKKRRRSHPSAAGARAERRAEDLHTRRALSFRLRVSRNDRASRRQSVPARLAEARELTPASVLLSPGVARSRQHRAPGARAPAAARSARGRPAPRGGRLHGLALEGYDRGAARRTKPSDKFSLIP